MNKQFYISDFDYDLPDHRIAKHPVNPRDHSKLLFWNSGEVSHHQFFDLPSIMPDNALLVYNNTKVIPARLIGQTETGATIEVFLTEALEPIDIQQNMQAKSRVVWQSMVGNKRRWNTDKTVTIDRGQGLKFSVTWHDRDQNQVEITWSDDLIFSQAIEQAGRIPLPPYIKRDVENEDKNRYQTVYAEHEGAVAAPTAGLHFTDEVMSRLQDKGIKLAQTTLHVGAGTFMPLTAENVAEHNMHAERFVLDLDLVKALIDHDGPVIAVGTTSLRVLESLYWFGVSIKKGKILDCIPQLMPYEDGAEDIDYKIALGYLSEGLQQSCIKETAIMIMPGYTMKSVKGLITNFHQPKSTLVMLIATLMGEQWREVYQAALDNDYRFLSYGDSNFYWGF